MRRRLLAALAALVLVLTAAAPIGTAAATVSALPPLRILTLGDSITEGPTLGAYRGELGRLLDLAGVDHVWIVAAEGGIGCGGWVSRATGLVQQHTPDLVLLNCGTNDGAQASAAYWMQLSQRTLITNLLAGSPTVKVVPAWITYASIGGYPYPDKAPAWLADTIPVANDSLYTVLYGSGGLHGPRVPTQVDLQGIPSQYLDAGGIHPTPSGHIVAGRLWYRALRVVYGWPDLVPEPCGLDGHRPGWGTPTVVPFAPGCTVL